MQNIWHANCSAAQYAFFHSIAGVHMRRAIACACLHTRLNYLKSMLNIFIFIWFLIIPFLV